MVDGRPRPVVRENGPSTNRPRRILCEGLPNDSVALRRKYFVQSNNSLHETAGAIDLAAAIGAVAEEQARAIQALAVRLKQMLKVLRK